MAMRRLSVLCAAILLSALFATPAMARAPWSYTCDGTLLPRVDACARQWLGLAPAEDFRARGDELLRVYAYADAKALLVVEIVLPKTGAGRLGLYAVTEEHVSRRSYVFPRERFALLRTQLMALTHSGAALHGGTPLPDDLNDRDQDLVGCHPLGRRFVEAEIGGTIGTAELSYCESDDYRFGDALFAAARQADPDCTAGWGDAFDEDVLAACPGLSGDRRRAAEGLRRFEDLLDWAQAQDFDGRQESEILAWLEPGVVFRQAGLPAVSGARAVLIAWQKVWEGPDYSWEAITSARARGDTVTLEGFQFVLVAQAGLCMTTFEAPIALKWHREGDGNLRLAELRIGAMARLPVPQAQLAATLRRPHACEDAN